MIEKIQIVHPSEVSIDFIQKMSDYSCIAYHRYGACKDAFPNKIDAIASARTRIGAYINTGNTAYLVDAANFLMFEYMFPRKNGTFHNSETKSIGRKDVNNKTRREHNKDIFNSLE